MLSETKKGQVDKVDSATKVTALLSARKICMPQFVTAARSYITNTDEALAATLESLVLSFINKYESHLYYYTDKNIPLITELRDHYRKTQRVDNLSEVLDSYYYADRLNKLVMKILAVRWKISEDRPKFSILFYTNISPTVPKLRDMFLHIDLPTLSEAVLTASIIEKILEEHFQIPSRSAVSSNIQFLFGSEMGGVQLRFFYRPEDFDKLTKPPLELTVSDKLLWSVFNDTRRDYFDGYVFESGEEYTFSHIRFEE